MGRFFPLTPLGKHSVENEARLPAMRELSRCQVRITSNSRNLVVARVSYLGSLGTLLVSSLPKGTCVKHQLLYRI